MRPEIPDDIPLEVALLVPGPLTTQTVNRNGMTHIRLYDPRDQREAQISMATSSALSITLLRDAIQKTLVRVWGNA